MKTKIKKGSGGRPVRGKRGKRGKRSLGAAIRKSLINFGVAATLMLNGFLMVMFI